MTFRSVTARLVSESVQSQYCLFLSQMMDQYMSARTIWKSRPRSNHRHTHWMTC